MSRGPQVSAEVVRTVRGLLLEGIDSKAQIYRYLEEKTELIDAGGRPSRSTIERLVDRLKPADPSDPWSFAKATEEDPDNAGKTLEAVVAIYRATDGRVWLTTALADWITRIRAAAPTVPPAWAYVLAFSYRTFGAQKKDTRCLDVMLASRAWERSDNGRTAHLAAADCVKLGQSDVYIDHTIHTTMLLADSAGRFLSPTQAERAAEQASPELRAIITKQLERAVREVAKPEQNQ